MNIYGNTNERNKCKIKRWVLVLCRYLALQLSINWEILLQIWSTSWLYRQSKTLGCITRYMVKAKNPRDLWTQLYESVHTFFLWWLLRLVFPSGGSNKKNSVSITDDSKMLYRRVWYRQNNTTLYSITKTWQISKLTVPFSCNTNTSVLQYFVWMRCYAVLSYVAHTLNE